MPTLIFFPHKAKVEQRHTITSKKLAQISGWNSQVREIIECSDFDAEKIINHY